MIPLKAFLRRAISRPQLLPYFLLHPQKIAHRLRTITPLLITDGPGLFSKITGRGPEQCESLMFELTNSDFHRTLLETYNSMFARDLKRPVPPAEHFSRPDYPGPYKHSNDYLYPLVRSLRPSLVVETGVQRGYSSAVILKAMEMNGAGHLHSIDLPDEVVNQEEPTGWFVPNELRKRWTLHLGDAKEILPTLLNQIGQIQIFSTTACTRTNT